jgi:hypothetical protein
VSGACFSTDLFLRLGPFPPPSPPPFLTALFEGFSSTMDPSDSSPVPRQLCLLGFLSRPAIAPATAGQTRSPRFRRAPFKRDVAFDPGRASAPRIRGAAHIAFGSGECLGPCNVSISRLNLTPRSIAVYASSWSSPSTPQHSLPGGRYSLPGPDLHRLDRASFAWRTTTYSLPVSRRTCVKTLVSIQNRRPRESGDPGQVLETPGFPLARD